MGETIYSPKKSIIKIGVLVQKLNIGVKFKNKKTKKDILTNCLTLSKRCVNLKDFFKCAPDHLQIDPSLAKNNYHYRSISLKVKHWHIIKKHSNKWHNTLKKLRKLKGFVLKYVPDHLQTKPFLAKNYY